MKTYFVKAKMQIELEVEVDAESPEQAGAIAQSWSIDDVDYSEPQTYHGYWDGVKWIENDDNEKMSYCHNIAPSLGCAGWIEVTEVTEDVESEVAEEGNCGGTIEDRR